MEKSKIIDADSHIEDVMILGDLGEQVMEKFKSVDADSHIEEVVVRRSSEK